VQTVEDGFEEPTVVPPILRYDFMKPLGLSANALALALRVPALPESSHEIGPPFIQKLN